ncbi:MAG: cytochrome c [candidate division Zixibacteria bacterium]|nr:cytochrome c [candidate division Zixibacteria bacterium]
MKIFGSTNSAIKQSIIFLAGALILVSAGCYRGKPSKAPPIHINPNMDDQPRFNAQKSSDFFEDGRAMRDRIEGTLPRGFLREDVIYYTGKDASGKLVKKSPVASTMEVLRRGQERFNIYCSPCHSRLGDGKGMVVQRGMFPPPTYHQARIRDIEDGHIFDVITNGIRNMPSYRSQIPVSDRWAIVNYLRVLQRSQNAKLKDIPESERVKIK